MAVIGVISDTHGLLRPEALAALRGVDRILHAGDVGELEVLDALRAVAPVTAVRGNVDHGAVGRALRETEVIEIEGISIYMLHEIQKLDLRPEAAGFRVIVYGHSHRPLIEEKKGVVYFNPGSAGPRRFRLPVSVGKLVFDRGLVRAEVMELEIGE